MVLSEVLQLVVIEIATQSHGGQDEHLPIIEARSSNITARICVEVGRDQPTELGSKFGVSEEMLQCRQDWYNLISAIEIEL